MFFFFNDTATTEIYTLSLHDALPIFERVGGVLPHRAVREQREVLEHHADLVVAQGPQVGVAERPQVLAVDLDRAGTGLDEPRSEEHTSELQSRQYLVCRLLLEKKKYK